ncbi:hypothetical protein [Pyrobaculum neutrophilum]|uniref:Uncharacterized protein n=1 Tax=Pyrobaculum neutrophilum (strain DSM 2338 / JCM 9278 / NBRC 100436 / V24Sta) TaxID=444157 RepID=B1YAW9_PYRNV|nr:hypothetical protein [Pyrobaculum neutrophilum]ACB40669.1 conserved hypothetical protein [Pyrobaculum neutrophilum V24Sta]
MSWDYLAVLLISFIMLMFFMYMFWRESAVRSRERPAEMYTVVKCGDGVERKRKYQEGDYVGKPVEDCAGGVVVGVFKEVAQQQQ